MLIFASVDSASLVFACAYASIFFFLLFFPSVFILKLEYYSFCFTFLFSLSFFLLFFFLFFFHLFCRLRSLLTSPPLSPFAISISGMGTDLKEKLWNLGGSGKRICLITNNWGTKLTSLNKTTTDLVYLFRCTLASTGHCIYKNTALLMTMRTKHKLFSCRGIAFHQQTKVDKETATEKQRGIKSDRIFWFNVALRPQKP